MPVFQFVRSVAFFFSNSISLPVNIGWKSIANEIASEIRRWKERKETWAKRQRKKKDKRKAREGREKDKHNVCCFLSFPPSFIVALSRWARLIISHSHTANLPDYPSHILSNKFDKKRGWSIFLFRGSTVVVFYRIFNESDSHDFLFSFIRCQSDMSSISHREMVMLTPGFAILQGIGFS